MSRRSFYLSLVPLGAILFVAVLAASVRAAPASGPGPLGFNAWATVSPVPTAVYGAAVTTDGTYAYAAGGYSFGAGSSVAQFARYNPTSNSWASLASLPDAMDDGAAIYSPINNKIYVFGGNHDAITVTNNTRIYDVGTNSWSGGAPMPSGRQQMCGGYYNRKIYLAGGYATGSVTTALSQTLQYDPVANTWSTSPASMPQGLGGAGCGVINGHLYVAGGRDGSTFARSQLYDYNLNANTWLTMTSLPNGVNVPGSAVVNGELWVFGGGNPFLSRSTTPRSPLDLAPATTNTTEIYIPSTNTWIAGPNLNVGRSFVGGTKVGDYVVAIGGFTGSTASNVTEVSNQPLCPINFSDVATTDYFYTPVRYLYCYNAISGYADGTFRPYNNTTRGQLTKIIVKAEGWAVYNPLVPTFRDVPVTDTFYEYIETAYHRGIVSGYSCGTGCLEFRPGNNVTRAQLSKIVVLAQGWTIYTPLSPTFNDVPSIDPFYQYVETAYYRGVISGYACGAGCLEFRPGNNATRGQISKIVYLAITQP